jgi:hypothetical protein
LIGSTVGTVPGHAQLVDTAVQRAHWRSLPTTGLHKTMALADPILAGLGFAGQRVATIETDDPLAMGEVLHAVASPWTASN